jgi:hypothetical protein
MLLTTALAFLVSHLGIAEPRSALVPQFTPTAAYRQETCHNFTVLINPELLEHKEAADEAFKELKSQLAAINRVVRAERLAALQKVRIWMEWEKRKYGAAEYHVSEGWLKNNGYNPEKAGGIEIANAVNFVKWSRGEQPWMVLHELAHAYHHQVLGERNADIEAAFQQAVERKLYESVDYIHGGKRRAYALTNAKEYYAELSEAYFGKNDFYPFVRAELAKHDPVGYQLMEKTWGKPRESTGEKQSP